MAPMALSSRKIPCRQHFLLSSYFRTHTITPLLQILGDGYMNRPPPKVCWGPSPSPPYISPPVLAIILTFYAHLLHPSYLLHVSHHAPLISDVYTCILY